MHALLASLLGLAPITSGSVDPNDPAVVAIFDAAGRHVCSGTLITEYVVVTAAHCVGASHRGMTIAVGPDTSGERIAVIDARAHPAFDQPSGANDIAVLFIDGAQLAMVPLPAGALTNLANATVRLVGFGETAGGAGDGGVKRMGTADVDVERADEIDLVPAPSLACVGDSGGPVLLDVGGVDTLVAVVSRGDGACALRTTAIRTDVHRDAFIAPYLADTAPGTAALWQRCLYAAQCATGVCVIARDEPAIRYCAPTCSDDDDCADDTECVAAASGGNACQYVLPTPGALGATCTSSADCVNGTCAAPAGESELVCTTRCVPGFVSCPATTECLRIAGAEHGCFPIDDGCGCRSNRGDVSLLVALALLLSRRARNGNRGSAVATETR